MRIVIDPGHGGKDPGAVHADGEVHEADVVLDVALRVADLLRDAGHVVVLTRGEDETVMLTERVRTAVRAKADRFVSIHCNSATSAKANGAEVWIWRPGGPAQTLAAAILAALVGLGLRDRGVRDCQMPGARKLAVLRQTTCPAVLVELGFLSSKADASMLLIIPHGRARLADAVAAGILAVVGSSPTPATRAGGLVA